MSETADLTGMRAHLPSLSTTLIGLALGCAGSGPPRPERPAPPRAEPEAGSEAEPRCAVVGSIAYWSQPQGVESFLANADVITHISLFWYHLDPAGRVRPYRRARLDRRLIEMAHQRDVAVLALVANLPDDEREGRGLTWDPERVDELLRCPSGRRRHVDELARLVRRKGFDGLLIDYEALRADQRDNFSAFIRELGARMRADGKTLAVALHPKTSEGDPREDNGSFAQDWDALHPHVDQLHLMTYAQHTSGSRPGPIASLVWVERILRYALVTRGLPAEKVFLGLPLYAQEWRLAGGQHAAGSSNLMYGDARKRMRRHQGTESWSREHASPFIVYSDDDGERIIWFEDGESSRRKLAMAAELGACNVHLWRLGGEDPGLWKVLRDEAGRRGAGGPGPTRGGGR